MDGTTTWTVASAKARLSEVLLRAKQQPQLITENGKAAAVVVSSEDWERRTRRTENLGEFLMRSPLKGVDLDLERNRDEPRDFDV